MRGVYAWCKDGRVRASAHFYNTPDDVDAFCAGVREAIGST